MKSLTKMSSGIKATWSKSAGAARYRLYVKVAGSSKWSVATNTSSTSYTWKNGKHGTTYTFLVRCVTSNGKTLTSYYNGTKSIKY